MKKSILIIGDSCLDQFVYCDTNRIAPDVPVPVLNEIETVVNPGMAMNVYENIKRYIPDVDIITNPNWKENVKKRYVHARSNHHFFRVDYSKVIEPVNVNEISLDYDLIVVSDYDKGFLSTSDIEYICSNHPMVFLDSKKVIKSWANKAKWIKINDYEYKNSIQHLDSELLAKIIHTLGENGCEVNGKHYPTESHAVRDTSGAGDSFMAGLVVKFFETKDIETSIIFANKSASKVVQIRGVSTI
jgi:D-glycero-beta-D-manno-heptose-7-phosphate kinase